MKLSVGAVNSRLLAPIVAAAALAAAGPLHAAVPGAPTNLVLKQTDPTGAQLKVDLTWVAPANNGGSAITSYSVLRFTNGVFDFSWQINSCCSASLPHKGNGIPTTFKVAAKNAQGSGPTVDATITPVGPTPVPTAAAKPAAPVLSVKSRSIDRIDLTWTAPAGEVTGYFLQYSPDPSFATGVTSLNPGLRTAYGFPVSCNNFNFRIQASNSAGSGPYSTPVASACPCPGGPPAPTGVTVTQTNATNCGYGVDIKWTAPVVPAGCPITNYSIDMTKNGLSTGTYGAGTGTSAHLPIEAGAVHTWAVKASNANGTGAASAPVSHTCK